MSLPQIHSIAESFPSLVQWSCSVSRRVLFYGAPGTGKTTLAARYAMALNDSGATCWAVGADPGTPGFGPPGCVSLARRNSDGWQVVALGALCSLDAARFRLPLVQAVGRLIRRVSNGHLLIDGPGVVRGMAGAELFNGLVEIACPDAVVALCRNGRVPLEAELAALSVPVWLLASLPEAKRPGSRARNRGRTALWDTHLEDTQRRRIDLGRIPVLGAPPPPQEPSAWVGRQVGLLDREKRTLGIGEIEELNQGVLGIRIAGGVAEPAALLVRDARRSSRRGFLETAGAPDDEMLRAAPSGGLARPRTLVPAQTCAVQLGSANATLVNGLLGDPLLHLRLREERRSLLFDLGDAARLPARIAHQVTDVFVSHAHFDHIGGFGWLLRCRIGPLPVCRVYGPPGLAGHLAGFVRGVLWDRVDGWAPDFEVMELREGRLCSWRVRAGEDRALPLGESDAGGGILIEDKAFRVRAITLDHGTPVLAFRFEPTRKLNIREEALAASGISPGPWLNRLKERMIAGELDGDLDAPDGRRYSVKELAERLVNETPGRDLVYATDLGDTSSNRQTLERFAAGASVLFCEAAFLNADMEQARRTGHLTARGCGEIARAAAVGWLVPFHISRRYESRPETVVAEVRRAFPRVLSLLDADRRRGGTGCR